MLHPAGDETERTIYREYGAESFRDFRDSRTHSGRFTIEGEDNSRGDFLEDLLLRPWATLGCLCVIGVVMTSWWWVPRLWLLMKATAIAASGVIGA
jgi:hypothetical protein